MSVTGTAKKRNTYQRYCKGNVKIHRVPCLPNIKIYIGSQSNSYKYTGNGMGTYPTTQDLFDAVKEHVKTQKQYKEIMNTFATSYQIDKDSGDISHTKAHTFPPDTVTTAAKQTYLSMVKRLYAVASKHKKKKSEKQENEQEMKQNEAVNSCDTTWMVTANTIQVTPKNKHYKTRQRDSVHEIELTHDSVHEIDVRKITYLNASERMEFVPIFECISTDPIVDTSISQLTTQFTKQISASNLRIVQLEMEKKEMQRHIWRLQKQPQNDELKKKLDTARKKNTHKQLTIDSLRQRNRKLKRSRRYHRELNKEMHTHHKKDLNQYCRMSLYRLRKEWNAMNQRLYGSNVRHLGFTLADCIEKNGEEVAKIVASVPSVMNIRTIYVNEWTKVLEKDDEECIQQAVTKVLSTVSERNWDKIRFGVHYKREVRLDSNGRACLSQPIRRTNQGIKSGGMCSARDTASNAHELFYNKFPLIKPSFYTITDPDDGRTDHVGFRSLRKTLQFNLDTITKDDIFIGHWPHHVSAYMDCAAAIWARCNEEYANDGNKSEDSDLCLDIEFDNGAPEGVYELQVNEEERSLLFAKTGSSYVPLFEYDVQSKRLQVGVSLECWLGGDGFPATHCIHTSFTHINAHLSDWPLGLSQASNVHYLLLLTTLKENDGLLFDIVRRMDKDMDDIISTGIIIDINQFIRYKYALDFELNGDLKFMHLFARTSGPGSIYFCYIFMVCDASKANDGFDGWRFINHANHMEYAQETVYTKAQVEAWEEAPPIYIVWTIEFYDHVAFRIAQMEQDIEQIKTDALPKQLTDKYLHAKRLKLCKENYFMPFLYTPVTTKVFNYGYCLVHSDERISEHVAVLPINAARQIYAQDPTYLIEQLIALNPSLRKTGNKMRSQIAENKTSTVTVGLSGDYADKFFEIVFDYIAMAKKHVFKAINQFDHVLCGLFSVCYDIERLRVLLSVHCAKELELQYGYTIEDVIALGRNCYRKWCLYLDPFWFDYVFELCIVMPNKLKVNIERSNFDHGGLQTVLEGTERVNQMLKGELQHNNRQCNYLKCPFCRFDLKTTGSVKYNKWDPSKCRKIAEKKKEKSKHWVSLKDRRESGLKQLPKKMIEMVEYMDKIKGSDRIQLCDIAMVENYNRIHEEKRNRKKVNKEEERIVLDVNQQEEHEESKEEEETQHQNNNENTNSNSHNCNNPKSTNARKRPGTAVNLDQRTPKRRKKSTSNQSTASKKKKNKAKKGTGSKKNKKNSRKRNPSAKRRSTRLNVGAIHKD